MPDYSDLGQPSFRPPKMGHPKLGPSKLLLRRKALRESLSIASGGVSGRCETKPKYQPVIAVDFSGRICDITGLPHHIHHHLDNLGPRPGTKEAMEAFYDSGAKVVVWTSHEDLEEVEDWLDEYQIPYHYINEDPDQPEDSRKIEADVYLDDRGEGNPNAPWPQLVSLTLHRIRNDLNEWKKQPKHGTVQHIIITGHSGAGKTTLSKLLAEKTGMPVWKVDQDKLWKVSKPFRDTLGRYPSLDWFDGKDKPHGMEKMIKKYRKILKKLVRKALNKSTPTILEGCHFLVCPGTLRGHRIVLLDAPEHVVISQRLNRDREEGKLKEDNSNIKEREEKARFLYNKLQPAVERMKDLDGIEILQSHQIPHWVDNIVREMEWKGYRVGLQGKKCILEAPRVKPGRLHSKEEKSLNCPECGSKAHTDTEGRVWCTNPPCRWGLCAFPEELANSDLKSSQVSRGKALLERYATKNGESLKEDLDSQGGFKPISLDIVDKADFITLPQGITGTNCGNCLFIKDGICTHPKLNNQPVNDHNCCLFWDAPGTMRGGKIAKQGQKAMTYLGESGGGALVPPAQVATGEIEDKALDEGVVTKLQRVANSFRNIEGLGPDYQRLFYHPDTGVAWWESFDGDEEEPIREVISRLESVEGVSKVREEAEASPPKDEGWILIFPELKEWNTPRRAEEPSYSGRREEEAEVPPEETEEEIPPQQAPARPEEPHYFTGVKIDHLGRRNCYVRGRRVPCASAPQKSLSGGKVKARDPGDRFTLRPRSGYEIEPGEGPTEHMVVEPSAAQKEEIRDVGIPRVVSRTVSGPRHVEGEAGYYYHTEDPDTGHVLPSMYSEELEDLPKNKKSTSREPDHELYLKDRNTGRTVPRPQNIEMQDHPPQGYSGPSHLSENEPDVLGEELSDNKRIRSPRVNPVSPFKRRKALLIGARENQDDQNQRKVVEQEIGK